jgi:hypothetical protein
LRHIPVLALGAMLVSTPSSAETGLAPLEALMTCVSDPMPGQILSALFTDGQLVARTGPGEDDDYCWSISHGLEWQGTTFTRLCVVTDDPDEIAAHPELYWEGSMAPWTEVWLIAPVSSADLAAWATQRLPEDSRFEVDPLDGATAESALACSEWHFPLGG